MLITDNTRIALINKEIETYRKFATVLESLKETIRAYDGKCFNKKLTEAMQEFLKYGKAERTYYVSAEIVQSGYGNYFDISIHCYDDLVYGEADQHGYTNNYRIHNNECNLRMKAEEVTEKTDGGKFRIKAESVISKFDEKIQYLHNEAERLEKALQEMDSMREDLKQLKQMMSFFNGKYNSRVKEVFCCNYDLKDNNSMQYRG